MTIPDLFDLKHSRRLSPEDGNPVDDATLAASVEQQIQMEQALLDSELAAGKNLVLNQVKGNQIVVHRPTCKSISVYFDRRASWFPYGSGLEDLRLGMRHGGFRAKMPELATEDDLEQLRSYRSCQTCSPDLRRPIKAYKHVRAITSHKLSEQHIGRLLISEDFEGEFIVTRIERTIDASGTVTILHGEHGTFDLPNGAMVAMLPK